MYLGIIFFSSFLSQTFVCVKKKKVLCIYIYTKEEEIVFFSPFLNSKNVAAGQIADMVPQVMYVQYTFTNVEYVPIPAVYAMGNQIRNKEKAEAEMRTPPPPPPPPHTPPPPTSYTHFKIFFLFSFSITYFSRRCF